MATPFLGEVKIISWNFAPRGWAFCNGQLLAINQNQALFSLLGTQYGGNGTTNFALPNLQSRTPIHLGGGFVQGQVGGEQGHTVAVGEMAAHTHAAVASSNTPGVASPANAFWASGSEQAYSDTANQVMNPLAVSSVGGSQPHENMSPYLVVNMIIALQGIFPSRN